MNLKKRTSTIFLIIGILVFLFIASKLIIYFIKKPENYIKNKNYAIKNKDQFQTDPTSVEYLINISKNKLTLKQLEEFFKTQLEYLQKNKNKLNSISFSNSLKIVTTLPPTTPSPPSYINTNSIGSINNFTTGMTNVGKLLSNDVSKKLFKGNKQSWRDIAIDTSIQTGIVVASITLTCLGFGFANPFLNMFSPYQYRGNFPIDLEKLSFSTEEELLKQSLEFCNADINKTIIYYNNVYLTAKLQINTNALCNLNNTNRENLDCIKNINFDPNIVLKSEDVKSIYKRSILSDMLGIGTPPYNMFNTSNYGFEFVSLNFNKNIILSVELYKAYKLMTGLEITYYQELALVDTVLKKDLFLNPWESRHIGDLQYSNGRPQIPGTLLGQLQIRCQKIFDMIRQLMKMYFNNLFWTHICHGNQAVKGPTDKEFTPNISFSCRIYTNYYFLEDRNFVIPNSVVQQPVAKETAEGDDFIKKDINWKAKTLDKFYQYLEGPLESLQDLKKMAGIKYLKGEENYLKIDSKDLPNYYYDAAGKQYKTNLEIIYEKSGGYPFGLSFPPYSEVKIVDKTPEEVLRFKTYCTPSIPINMRNSCSDLTGIIDATIFNNSSSVKTYSNNMKCKGTSYQSCLLPGMSPGDKNGKYTDKSRIAFCLDDKLNSYPLEENTSKCIDNNVKNIFDITSAFQAYMKLNYTLYDFSSFQVKLEIDSYKRKEEETRAIISFVENPSYENKYDLSVPESDYEASYIFDTENEFGLDFAYDASMMVSLKDYPLVRRTIIFNFYFKVFQNYMIEKNFDIICPKIFIDNIPSTTYQPTTPQITTYPPTTYPPTTPQITTYPPTTPQITTYPPTTPQITTYPPTPEFIPFNSYNISNLFLIYNSPQYLYDFSNYLVVLNISEILRHTQKKFITYVSIDFNLKKDRKNIFEILTLDSNYESYYIFNNKTGLDFIFKGNIVLKVIDSPFEVKKLPLNFNFKVLKDSLKEKTTNILCKKISN